MSRSTMRSCPTMTRLTSNSVRSSRAAASATVDESVGSVDTALLTEAGTSLRDLYVVVAGIGFR